MNARYLSQTKEFAAAVARRRAEAIRRELRRMLDAPIYLGHGR